IVRHRWLGISTRSFLPAETGGAPRCSTTSSAMRLAFSPRLTMGTYSHPRAIGATSYDRLRETPLAKSTAVALRFGYTCTMYCWIEEPSLEAKYLSSAWNPSEPNADMTLGFFFTVRAALWISSSFSSTDTLNGSFSCGTVQRSTYALVGASLTGAAWSARLAFATVIASRVMRAISAVVTIGDAANPHWPLTITRTPNPKLWRSLTNGTSSVAVPPRCGERR